MTNVQPPDYESGQNRQNYISLRDYVEQRFVTLERDLDRRVAGIYLSIAVEKENRERALAAAKQAQEYRLDALNELRDTVQLMAESRASREDLHGLRNAHEEKIASLQRMVYTLIGAMAIIQVVLQFLAR